MSDTRRGVMLAGLVWIVLSALVLAGCATGRGVDKQGAAEANAGMGADFLRQNNNNQALTYFRKALGFDDNNFTANWGMAVVSDRLGNTDQARSYYQKTLSIQPAAAVENSYAAFLCQHGQTDEAIQYFNQAANDPRYADADDALANAGLCLHRAGRDAPAKTYFRKALAANASQPTALTQMAAIEHAAGHDLKARAFLERADSVTQLDAEQLLLGARIELAMQDRAAARAYLKRHNASRPAQAMSLNQLERLRE